MRYIFTYYALPIYVMPAERLGGRKRKGRTRGIYVPLGAPYYTRRQKKQIKRRINLNSNAQNTKFSFLRNYSALFNMMMCSAS